jgi:hypothetical protein
MVRMFGMNTLRARWSRTKALGFIFICVGIASYGGWILWLSTRANRPVIIPISMAVGHVRTQSFKVNRNAIYEVEIEVQKTIPFDSLNCLLGTAMARTSTTWQECPDRPSVVKASWVLTSNGQTVARGSTDTFKSASWGNDSISRVLGQFHSQSGRPYVLDVDILADGTSLGPGNPHLKVEVSSVVYEDESVETVILFLLTIVPVLIGASLLLVSFVRNRAARRLTAAAVASRNE